MVPEGQGRGVKVQMPLTAALCICLILSLILLPAYREGWEEKAAMQKQPDGMLSAGSIYLKTSSGEESTNP